MMPFYQQGSKLEVRSNVSQGAQGNCYIVAAVAAHSLCNNAQSMTLDDVVKKVGHGIGGNSDRAFKALGLTSFSKSESYKDHWREWIVKAVDNNFPVCLGVEWSNLDTPENKPVKTGNHVIYITGYDVNKVYARDQQNNHVLISIEMRGEWVSDEFVAGRRTSRECKVKWVGFAFPTREQAVKFQQ